MTDAAFANFLLWLRMVGFKLSPPGYSKLPRTLLRRLFRYVNATVQVDDFAGEFVMELMLSEHMQRRIFWMGYYSEDVIYLLDRILVPGMTVVDVGANIGEISLFAAKKVDIHGNVFAFEPIDMIARKLEHHVQQNRLRQVSIQRWALGDSSAEDVPMYASCGQETSDKHGGLGSIYSSDSGETPLQKVQMTTLDAWLANHPVDRMDLLKIDIEGAEFACLRGAANCVSHFRPKIIVEIQDFSARRAGHKATDILDFLSELNYEFHRIDSGGKLTALTSEKLGEFQNVLCTPRT